MDLRFKQMFVSTASLTLALLGFSLSVLTAIFGSFISRTPPARVVRTAPATSTRRGRPDSLIYPSKPRRSHVKAAPHEHQSQNKTTRTRNLSSPSTSPTSSSPSTHPEPSSSAPTLKCLFIVSSEEDHHILRFSNLRPPWVEKKPKVRRCLSSTSSQSTDETDQIPPNLPEIHSGSVKPCAGKGRTKNILLRTKSAPNICPIEKKRSQPLRTQPYAAPYFLPPPVPAPRKITRSRTLPPPEHRSPRLRSQSPTPQPRHRLRIDTLAPPVDRGLAK